MQITQANLGAMPVEQQRPGLERIFTENKERVYRTAYRVTGNSNDAEDVLQTVFLRLVRQDRGLEIGNVAAYLHRSAVNASLDVLRRRRDAQLLSLDEEPNQAEAVSRETTGHSTELRDWLRKALARLNPRWAEMFILRFVEDYSNNEIAAMMKTSAAVVAVVLHRTRAQLRRDFKSLARGTR